MRHFIAIGAIISEPESFDTKKKKKIVNRNTSRKVKKKDDTKHAKQFILVIREYCLWVGLLCNMLYMPDTAVVVVLETWKKIAVAAVQCNGYNLFPLQKCVVHFVSRQSVVGSLHWLKMPSARAQKKNIIRPPYAVCAPDRETNDNRNHTHACSIVVRMLWPASVLCAKITRSFYYTKYYEREQCIVWCNDGSNKYAINSTVGREKINTQKKIQKKCRERPIRATVCCAMQPHTDLQ